MWKKRVPFSILVGLVGSVAIAMVFIGLISPRCPPSPFGDYALQVRGVASESGWVGFKVDGRLFGVDVGSGETAEQVGPRLTQLMKAAGLLVDCERYDGERYILLLRNVDGRPAGQRQAPGIYVSGGGPIRDHPGGFELDVRSFFVLLNTNNLAGMRYDITTREFFREQVSDMMASMAANGEQVVIESMGEPVIDCYQATIALELVWEVGAEEQHVDGYLTLSREGFTGWLISGGVIR